MAAVEGFDITQYMDLNDEEREFLEFYRRCPQDIRDLLDKFMDGTPEERKEAGEIIYAMIDDLQRQQDERNKR